MPAGRSIHLASAAVLLLVAAAAFIHPGCGAERPSPSVTAPAGDSAGMVTGAGALASPAASAAPPSPAASTGSPPASAPLEAASTVRLFCSLLDSHRRVRAAELLASRRVWPRRELRALATFRFLSARVVAAPSDTAITLRTRVLVHTTAPSPLPNGVATLFFTLGRVGTTTGGWLITAVTTSP